MFGDWFAGRWPQISTKIGTTLVATSAAIAPFVSVDPKIGWAAAGLAGLGAGLIAWNQKGGA